jgi:hypothetical protein
MGGLTLLNDYRAPTEPEPIRPRVALEHVRPQGVQERVMHRLGGGFRDRMPSVPIRAGAVPRRLSHVGYDRSWIGRAARRIPREQQRQETTDHWGEHQSQVSHRGQGLGAVPTGREQTLTSRPNCRLNQAAPCRPVTVCVVRSRSAHGWRYPPVSPGSLSALWCRAARRSQCATGISTPALWLHRAGGGPKTPMTSPSFPRRVRCWHPAEPGS